MKHRYAWALCLLTACAGSVTQDPPQDPGTIPDASTDAPTDAPVEVDAGSLVIGRPCTTDADCGGGEMRCQPGAPGGYCTFWCAGDAECPTGSICAPVPLSRISGTCMKTCANATDCRTGYACEVVYLFPGQPDSPHSSAPVCWESQDAGP